MKHPPRPGPVLAALLFPVLLFPQTFTAPPDSETQAKILDAIRDYARTYTQNLPNFICAQITRRQIDASGTGEHFQSVDKIQEQLTYFDHHEAYKVIMVNNQM